MNRVEVLSKHFTAGAAEERRSYIETEEEYKKLYQWSVTDPNGFWAYMAKDYVWSTPFEKEHLNYNFDTRAGPIHIEWFKGGKTNISYNCLDRWVAMGRGDQPCFVAEANEPGQERIMTYSQVLAETCRLANYLKAEGVKKGDAVTIYMPMVCECPIAMLACARIGAVHSVVFAGFSAESLASRILDCQGKIVLTASGVMRGTKLVPLKQIVDEAIAICNKQGFQVPRVLCYDDPTALARTKTPWVAGRDAWYQDVVSKHHDVCPASWLDAEDRLFLLYTSGSTGKPKGVVHTTGGYMVGAGTTCKFTFDLHPGDMFWCSADCGWITGHSYLTYGPLLNGATSVLFGSVPAYPTPSRIWEVIEKYKVRQFYTAPTLLRSLLQMGDEHVKKTDRSSLRVLGSVGEPINEHAWHWFNEVVGEKRCPIVDTWWQTETGAHMITPLPGKWCKLKPGSASLPFFGVQPVVLNADGQELKGATEGILAVKFPWPSMARTLHGDHDRFASVYFAPFKGYYFTGDGCRRDQDGYIWITGRVDDVINVSGHRIGTAEVESALTEHNDCAEAAVIGIDHPVKGQAIYAYVTLKNHARRDDTMRKTLNDHVRKIIGPFAVPEVIHWAPALPKTRSGKIMRRVLRKIASREDDQLGDVSTLAEPAVVEQLIAQRGK